MLRARKIYEVALKILAYFRQRNLIWLMLGGIQSIYSSRHNGYACQVAGHRLRWR
jgi:hypothetical protein